jgi:F-type H+-transporting ATPase subunit delta
MSNNITIARPYAGAVFEYALAQKQLALWLDILSLLAEVVGQAEAASFIANPASIPAQQVALLQAICNKAGHKDSSVTNWITLLADNRRLMVLPEIKTLYEELKAEQEKTLVVDVTSFSAPSKAQQENLREKLSLRLQRSVVLNVHIDPALLGGAIIRAGDLVIDGSVRSQLNKLATNLAA